MTSDDPSRARLRIALFTYSTKPRGGVIHCLALAEHLQALGHYVHVFALGKGQQGFFRPVQVPCTVIPVADLTDEMPLEQRIQLYIQTYADFLRAGLAGEFDMFHAQDCISANALWRIREEGRLARFVRTVHHIDDFTTPSLVECQDTSIYRPDHRIVVSAYWQQRLLDEFGVPSEIIFNGVDLGRFQPPVAGERAAARELFGLGDACVFLNIGGVEPRKNSIRLLHAFEQVKERLEQQGRRALLLMAGGETLLDHSAYRQEFFALLERSTVQVDRDIRLLGVVPDADLPRLYHAADALAFPSVKEGWGLVVLEALASALPVLAADLPVFREYLQPEENALLVDPLDTAAIADGMLRLSDDAARCGHLAQNGLKTAWRFGWDATARAHETLYYAWLR